MSGLPLWRVEELRIRYELEPGLRDLFVEGVFDREVFSQIADSGKIDRVSYEIDVVDVPDGLLAAHGLSTGSKQNVIALARELSSIPDPCLYRCLVDRDLDHWFGTLEDTPRLRWTLQTSLECYFLSSSTVRTLLVTIAKAKISDWDQFYVSFTSVLGDIYSLRLASHALGLNLTWIPFEKSLSNQGGLVVFATDAYAEKVLNANAKSHARVLFSAEWKAWRAKIGEVDGSSVRGHDFMDLMAWSVRKFKGLGVLADAEALARFLILMAPDNEPLVRAAE